MKKLLELSIVIWTLVLLLYFILYFFYFDTMCNGFSKNIKINQYEIISNIWTCKSSFVCQINNIETNNKNIITNWECNKKINNYLHFEYYLNYITNLINNNF